MPVAAKRRAAARHQAPPAAPVGPRSQGRHVIDFVQTFCRHTKGSWAGKPMLLFDWQQRLILDLFELRPDGKRRYRTALIGLPRKNGKSSLCAALALYGLVADDEPGAEVYSVAGDKEQARIVFGTARRMVELNPVLGTQITVYRDALEYRASGSIYRVLSADAELKQGLNPSFVIFDEVHVQPNDQLWLAMELGMGTREQPLLIGITTADVDDDDRLCNQLYSHGRKVQGGEVSDPAFFFRWWEPADPNCDWRDPRVWAEANPALRTPENPDGFLLMEALEADAQRTPEHEFRRYHLDQVTKTAVAWLPHGAWDACKDAARELDPALPVRVGIDMAYSNDAAAVVCAQKQADGVTVLRARVWENPYAPTHSQHAHWKINPLEVEAHLRELRETFPVAASEIDGEVKPGPEFAYDPAWFTRSAPVLEGDGLAMLEFPQSDARMIPVAQTFYQLITEKQIAHDGDPTLKRHVEHAIVDRRPRGWRISKATVKRKIDACIAAAIAAYRAQEPPPADPTSVYASRGFLVWGGDGAGEEGQPE